MQEFRSEQEFELYIKSPLSSDVVNVFDTHMYFVWLPVNSVEASYPQYWPRQLHIRSVPLENWIHNNNEPTHAQCVCIFATSGTQERVPEWVSLCQSIDSLIQSSLRVHKHGRRAQVRHVTCGETRRLMMCETTFTFRQASLLRCSQCLTYIHKHMLVDISHVYTKMHEYLNMYICKYVYMRVFTCTTCISHVRCLSSPILPLAVYVGDTGCGCEFMRWLLSSRVFSPCEK